MLWLKSCPRCRGDVYSEKDIFETYLKCLQCGHVLSEGETDKVDLGRRLSTSSAPQPLAGQRAA